MFHIIYIISFIISFAFIHSLTHSLCLSCPCCASVPGTKVPVGQPLHQVNVLPFTGRWEEEFVSCLLGLGRPSGDLISLLQIFNPHCLKALISPCFQRAWYFLFLKFSEVQWNESACPLLASFLATTQVLSYPSVFQFPNCYIFLYFYDLLCICVLLDFALFSLDYPFSGIAEGSVWNIHIKSVVLLEIPGTD